MGQTKTVKQIKSRLSQERHMEEKFSTKLQGLEMQTLLKHPNMMNENTATEVTGKVQLAALDREITMYSSNLTPKARSRFNFMDQIFTQGGVLKQKTANHQPKKSMQILPSQQISEIGRKEEITAAQKPQKS